MLDGIGPAAYVDRARPHERHYGHAHFRKRPGDPAVEELDPDLDLCLAIRRSEQEEMDVARLSLSRSIDDLDRRVGSRGGGRPAGWIAGGTRRPLPAPGRGFRLDFGYGAPRSRRRQYEEPRVQD